MKAVPVAGESSDTSKSAQGSTAEAVETSTPEPAPPEATPAPADQAAVPAPASEREQESAPRAEAEPAPEPDSDFRAEAEPAPPVRESADEPARTGAGAAADAATPTGAGAGTGTESESAAGTPTPLTADAPAKAQPEAPAEASADASSEAPAKASAEGSTKASTKSSSEEPTKAPAKAPIDPAAEAPIEASAKAAAPGSTKASSEAPAKAAAEADNKASAGARGAASSKAGTEDSSRTGDGKPTGAGAGAGRAAVPESDNERTSTFVALKPLESTGAPAKAPAAPAPTTPSWAKGAAPAPAKAPAPDERTAPPARTRAPGPAAAAFAPPARTQAPAPAATAPAPASTARPTAPEPPRPVPPLDLLAQLTNTPPPPETTARTLGRRAKIWTPVLLGLVGAAVVAQMVRPLPAPTVTTGDAAASFTFDGTYTAPWPSAGQGAMRVIGSGDASSFGEQKPVPIASVAKVMTAYVILTDHPLKKGEAGPQIEIDAKMVADGASADESRVEGLTAGTKYSQQDVLKMLMIPSGNNAARLLARWDGGSDSEAAFVEKMNAAAKELGMTNTTYTDPSGLDAGTKSTAEDQVKLAEAVMRFDAFRAIVSMASAPIPGLAKPLINNNGSLLLDKSLSVAGIKTGSSSAAGGALMWAAYKSVGGKDQLIVGATLEQRAPAPDKDALESLELVKTNSRKVIESVRGALTAAGAVKKGQVVGYVDDKLGKRTPLMATRDGQVAGVPGQKVRLRLADGGKALPHAAKAGTQVGELVLGDGPGAATIPLALKEDLVEPSFGAKVLRLG
ncbi:serine hydrolase [Streptomyces sp. NPDC098789]|uniref:serine hydrolase n=1 Tax=Streptomyces sp. NPDC098789 TaxID=3366098 RepID=UPI0038289F8A